MPGGPKDSKEASAVGGKAVSGESSWRWVSRGMAGTQTEHLQVIVMTSAFSLSGNPPKGFEQGSDYSSFLFKDDLVGWVEK